jgi:3-phenylpropionate/trans-cinnamate dioxygenase ferredoxin subunit
MSSSWVQACRVEDVEEDDVIRFDYSGRTFAVYRLSNDRFYATDGLCTHAKVHLAGGFVMDETIECPKHNGRFDVTTGRAKGAPACVDLRTYPVRREGDAVLIEIPDT